jgi:hypothetical protein
MKKLFIFVVVLFAMTFSNDAFSQITKLYEGFEAAFPPTGWTTYNVAGSVVWTTMTAPLGATFGGPTNVPKDGSKVAYINYQAPNGEDWLVTKKTALAGGDSLIFFIIKQFSDGPWEYDSLNVRVSTTDSLMTSFTNVPLRLCVHCLPVGATEIIWRRFAVSLNSFAGQNVYIAFQHKDTDGHGIIMDSVTIVGPNLVGVANNNGNVPKAYKLNQNYPNPFNPTTKISFDIPKSNFTTLKIYNTLGELVSTLVDGNLEAGTHAYDFNASSLASGIYYYRLESGSFTETQKMSLIK